MDAIKFLLQEHKKVRRALTSINQKSKGQETKKRMFKNLCQDILRHETMEEKVWYPYLKKNLKLKKTINHLISEENVAEKEIKKIKKVKEDAEWNKKFLKFKKAVLHHAAEEEKKLFPKVKNALETKELTELGKKMQIFKKKWLAKKKYN
ncbi:MAG TPA: hemerythrin domain-containing protein [Gammaproteobacteria bacterium]|jgi:hemerythrin superfamily protein|nr:hemerythrin domain-containing protein [Gammaproteobacteria bacterium]